MDGIANVAKQQQSQVSSQEAQGRATQVQQQAQKMDVVKEIQKEVKQDSTNQISEINTKEQVRDLVDQLNKAMLPMNTNLRFGVDAQDVFFVSVVESDTSKLIRRFPAAEAADFLPKMQELTGMLFDSRG
ncbi:MAG: flagellar protein FlaG [Sulfurimonas sp.]|nr:flagellar protein FlaG [Sulfurimonas sp.]